MKKEIKNWLEQAEHDIEVAEYNSIGMGEEETMDYPVDFLCYTPEEFEEKRKEISIVRLAIKEGVVI